MGRLLGSTGLAFEAETVASTGYVLAKDAWGHGYATESLNSMAALAGELGIVRFYALAHPSHLASIRVLQKCGFAPQLGTLRRVEFPNLEIGEMAECPCHVRILARRSACL